MVQPIHYTLRVPFLADGATFDLKHFMRRVSLWKTKKQQRNEP
jgi:hypothetical protein